VASFGRTRGELGEGLRRNILVFLFLVKNSRLGELNSKFCVDCMQWHDFDENYDLKFMMHMRGFGGCGFGTVLLEF